MRCVCEKCGKEEVGGAKFCSVCGTKLAVTEEATQKQDSFCPKCGKEVGFAMKFCPFCGEKLPEKKKFCSSCGAEADGKFCEKCGAPLPENGESGSQAETQDEKCKLSAQRRHCEYRRITAKYVVPSLYFLALFFSCLFCFLIKSVSISGGEKTGNNFTVFYFLGECYRNVVSFPKPTAAFVVTTVFVSIMLVGVSAAFIVALIRYFASVINGKKFDFMPIFVVSIFCCAVGYFALKNISACILANNGVLGGIKLTAAGRVGLILSASFGFVAYVLQTTVETRPIGDVAPFVARIATKLSVAATSIVSVIVASGYDVVFNQMNVSALPSKKSLFTSFGALLAFSDGSKSYAETFLSVSDSLTTKTALGFAFKLAFILFVVATVVLTIASANKKELRIPSFVFSLLSVLVGIGLIIVSSLWTAECVRYYNSSSIACSASFPRTITAFVFAVVSAMLSFVSLLVESSGEKKAIA